MKKLNVFLVLTLIATLFISCDSEKIVDFSQTPQATQDFVSTHFPGVNVVKVVKDKEGLGFSWDVYLANGFELQFDKEGNWMKVDGNNQPIPASILALLPGGITTYCSTNYPNSPIVEIDKDSRRYHVELQNSIELEFDLNGNFIKIDN